jgi:hypothetical protein
MQGIAQKILSDPGKYSIQQLTQAVQNGTLPAYIGVPIIQDKVQQQKKSQMMQQGQQAPQKAPPIAQQIMQEARGLEALPTNLPQQYAGGGIVAFEEGGEVERYQSKGLVYETPYDRMNRENREREAREAAFLATPEGREIQSRRDRAGLMAPFAAAADIPSGFYNGIAGLTQMGANAIGVPRIGRALGIYDKDVTSVEIPKIGTGTATPFFDKLRTYEAGTGTAPTAPAAPAVKPYDPATATLRSQYTNEPYSYGPAKDRAPAKDASGLGGDSALDRRPNFGLKAPGTFTPPVSKSMTAQTQELLGGYEGADGYLERAAARDKAAADAIAQASKSVTGEAFSDYKNVLEKEAKDFGADKEQAKGMAIFKAGLAMMAGTSRHAFENIGKGAMVGAEDYQAAAKDIKKAQQENRKELALIEQARRAEARGDRDTAIARLEASRDRGDVRDRYVGDALQKAYGIDRAQAYDMAKTQFTTQADIFRTDLAGQYGLAGNRISGEYGLKAAQVKANREPIMTPYQMARLRADAEKRVDADAVRAELAKKLKLSKTPAPGADASFDAKFQSEYDAAINGHINRFLGAGGGGGGGDFGAVDSLLDKYAPKR